MSSLLIYMLAGQAKYKMMYAYKFFVHNYPVPSPHHTGSYTAQSARKMVATRQLNGTYLTGNENNFSKPAMIQMVKTRMTENNPMKDEHQRKRMRLHNNNPLVKTVLVNNLVFPSIAAAGRHYNVSAHIFMRDYIYELVSG